ncbi:MAG: tetratricopeptide repeat protein, partial [Gemmatimonadetes bacterium]|nr:tetratricopeptide repeat protein [Gemmatimonadota bacterium]
AREVQGFLLESFGSVGGDDVAGDSVTVRQVLDARAGQVDALYADEPTLRAEMFHVLADGYERLGILEEAQRWAERAVEERRSLASGSAEADLAGSLGLLGWVRHQQGDLEEAEARLEESVERWRGIQTDSAGLARALNDLCGVYTTLGRFEEAEALCVEAMAIRRDIYPPNHRAIAVTANNLGNAVGSQGRRDESLEWAQESARILEAALGRRHRRTLFALRNVAVGHAWLGDWERSAQMSREIADAYEELGGPLDIDLAWSLQSYGAALGRLGRIQEADSVLSRGYEIASTRLGDHPLTAYLLDQRRGLLQRDGRRPEALDLARRSLDMYRRLYADDHPDVATGLTRVGELATDPSEAVEAYEAAAGMLGRLEGEGGQGAVRATISLARALLADDRPAEALSLFDSLEASIPEAFGTDHPYAVAPYLGRAQAHAALGERGAAREWLSEARERLVGGVDVEANQRWLEEVVQAVQR